jgi:hypothetical protein
MRKITFLLTLLLMYVGVMPMMAEYVDAEIDESKTYVIKIKDTQNYIFAEGDKYPTYRTDTPYDATDTKFHFVFVKYNKTTYDDNSNLYYIQSVSSSKYAFRNGSSSYTGEPAVELATSKNNNGLWIVKKEGDTFKIIRAKYNNGFYENTNQCWNPSTGGDPISFSTSPSKSLVIEALDGSEIGGGESGGNEGGGSEGEPEDEIKYFRLKEKSTGKYFTIINNDWNTGATSGVNLSALNYANDNQVFTREASGVGFKLKAKTGYYVKLHQWNVNANTTSADEATMIRFNEVGENEFTFSWNNTFSTYALNYIKVQDVDGTYYPFCDAAEAYAATWILEEVASSISVNLTEITSDDHLLTGIEGRIATFSAPFASAIPAGVTAYYAQPMNVNGTDVISLTSLKEGVIPAEFGVHLVGDTDKVEMLPSDANHYTPNNAFSHSAGSNVTLEANSYIFVRGDQGIGFYPAKVGSSLNANKAYLKLNSNSQVSAFKLTLDEVTAIEGVNAQKVDTAIYDLSGRRVSNVIKGGIYIQNGKKFIVK